MKKIRILLIAAALCAGRAPGEDKLDDGIGRDGLHPVFVRMERQLFARGGDYEAFGRENAPRLRSDLRPEVVATLRQYSDASWETIRPLVEKLREEGLLHDLQRYWIVNGFACRATGEACRELAKHPGVSFIYLQRLKVPLHRAERTAGREPAAAGQEEVFREVLESWEDDSGEPLATDSLEVPWNLKRIKADQAWTGEGATGRGVVVALIDSGLLVTPSLTRALWKHPGEILNGRDDDGNGYVDDLFGWDFRLDSRHVLDDGSATTHGSICAGIVAGRPLNGKKLITGVAPRARLMLLRNAGGSLKAYEYAVDNGADVLSMSYMWAGIPLGNYRGLYRLAHEHMAAAGVVAVGGAGNFAQTQPRGRQIALPKDIPCVIAAAGIVANGAKAPASSEGPCTWSGVKFYDDYPEDRPLAKPDVTGCFGGFPVWSRPSVIARSRGRWTLYADEGRDTGLVTGPSGNSFAGPHAAGVAALMLSVRPDLNAWQVKALMERTCTDLGPEGRDYTYGAGLLDALEAVRAAKETRHPPRT